jgi:hypothetical protein
MRLLPGNIRAEDVTSALQELGYDVISTKRRTAYTSLPLFLITLGRNKNFTKYSNSSLCNIKVEVYRFQNGLTVL